MGAAGVFEGRCRSPKARAAEVGCNQIINMKHELAARRQA
jgi:hypothetical protein